MFWKVFENFCHWGGNGMWAVKQERYFQFVIAIGVWRSSVVRLPDCRKGESPIRISEMSPTYCSALPLKSHTKTNNQIKKEKSVLPICSPPL